MENHNQEQPTPTESAVRRGRILIILVISAAILFAIMQVADLKQNALQQKGDNAPLATLVGHFVLTIVLIVFLFRGHNWARYLIAVLCGWVLLFALISLLTDFPADSPALLANYTVKIIASAFSILALTLLPSVDVFLRHQREHNRNP